ncbi:MAG: preprotein translocase subunit SecE [Bdellovibrionales bacterium]|nr:preprotein translocase subunit SecE [Bdellovibrionales bacterium]
MENEKNNQSIVNFAFVVAGFLAYFVVAVLFELLADTFGPVARFRNIEAAKHGLPVAAGLILFLSLFLNKKVHIFADECVAELRKVVWPSQRDTMVMTIVCCVMVVVAGIGFGVFDFLSSQVIKLFIGS